MKQCKDCNIEKSIDYFEVTSKKGSRRAVCKPCYNAKKSERAKIASKNVDQSTVPKPSNCASCGLGPDKVEYTWRTDVVKGGWRPECNRCTHSKGYTDKYRNKCRKNDEAGYLKRNADTHLVWSHNNKDRNIIQEEKNRCEPDRKFKALKSYVKYKNNLKDDNNLEKYIDFNDAEKLQYKMTNPCYYCGYKSDAGGRLNGLDRVNPNGKYNEENTVSCCGSCNSVKLMYTIDEFITGVRDIIKYRGSIESNDKHIAFGGTALRRKLTKNKTDDLTVEDKLCIWSNSCYLCGKSPSLGIDRLDSSKNYSIDNCKSCCTLCNYLKKDSDELVFLAQISRINDHTSHWVLGDVRNVLDGMYGPRLPVGPIHEDGTVVLIFPSVSSCSNIIKCGISTIIHSIDSCKKLRGHNWKYIGVSDYKKQSISYNDSITILQKLGDKI